MVEQCIGGEDELNYECRHDTAGWFRVLVCNLCVSDFLMGVYLMMVGSADAYYSGQYLWKREVWTQSAACRVAGFLGMLSSEVSAFVICVVTLDRLLVLQFPFKRHLHLTPRSAMTACGVAWVTGIILSTVPLLPTTGWEFYSQTGICLPLPITRKQFPGLQYAFGVFVILNFVLFLLIGVGQAFIYRAVHSSSTEVRMAREKQDTAIARRLFLIVLSDFCCWFPVGLMGLLAAQGMPIPGDVTVITAIFVLPLNSAINPFLYTLGMLLERRRKQKAKERIQATVNNLRLELVTWPDERVQELIERCEHRLRGKHQSRD
nr:hypothetical protein BaRGS_018007 [Batillaria attramentaria]